LQTRTPDAALDSVAVFREQFTNFLFLFENKVAPYQCKMGRKRDVPIAKLFEQEDANTTKCRSCVKVFEGSNPSNPMKPLKKMGHEELLKEFEALEAKHKLSE